jgi:hypothetical protein
MQRPNQALNTLLFLIIILALGGGLAIVYFTSPRSFDFSRFFPALASETATSGPSLTPTETAVPPSETATETATSRPATRGPSPTPSATAPATSTLRPSLTPTATGTQLSLPPGVRALAVVTDRLGTATARVRSTPNGSQVIASLPAGTVVQVLFGRVVVDGVEWVEVRLASGTTGWMATFLLEILIERLGSSTSTPAVTAGSSQTATPTQSPAPGETQPPEAPTSTSSPAPVVPTDTPTATEIVPPSMTPGPSETPTPTPETIELPSETPEP